jgi:hypothetical protein
MPQNKFLVSFCSFPERIRLEKQVIIKVWPNPNGASGFGSIQSIIAWTLHLFMEPCYHSISTEYFIVTGVISELDCL